MALPETDRLVDRIDVLLQDLDVTASRRVKVPLVKMREAASDETEGATPWAAQDRDSVHYLVLLAGDPGRFRDVTSGERRIKEVRVGLALTLVCSGEAATDKVQTQTRSKQLHATWDDVVDVLQDGNNHRRVETGWIGAQDFTSTTPKQDGDRLVMIAGFVARYQRQMGAY